MTDPVILRPCSMSDVAALCARYHGYSGAGTLGVYAFGVFEQNQLVAAFAWQPPPVGAAKSVCPEAPAGVLALSRMVAVPKAERRLRHISKPLRQQMRRLIDRGRWPVLVTYSDESMGHTGHVYKCSGWQPTMRAKRVAYTNAEGVRCSAYRNGAYSAPAGASAPVSVWLQRWEHWACQRGAAAAHMHAAGWARHAIPGRVWKSGKQAYRWVKTGERPDEG